MIGPIFNDRAEAGRLLGVMLDSADTKIPLPGRMPIPAKGRTAILVDDGIATGASMKAAATHPAGRAGRGRAGLYPFGL